jgi:hypothetical protein
MPKQSPQTLLLTKQRRATDLVAQITRDSDTSAEAKPLPGYRMGGIFNIVAVAE